jgi:cytochrome o ubiquinol oxidase operon protein cyoD
MARQNQLPNASAAEAYKLRWSYIIGFTFSLIFTLAAFGLVMDHKWNSAILCGGIILLAVLQIFAQVIFFLRLNARTEHDRWNLIAFVFTLLIVTIMVAGTLWIMYNLNYNMMSH